MSKLPSSVSRLLPVLLALGVCSLSALAQVNPEGEGGPVAEDDIRMLTPPPVSTMMYPAVAGTEARTNYLAPSLVVDVADINNVLPTLTALSTNSTSTAPIKDTIYSFIPSVVLDRTTSRQQMSATYTPTFTFYEPSSQLDSIDQTASLSYQGSPSTYSAIVVHDFFARTSNVFDGSFPFSTGGLTGGVQAASPAAIAPFAEQLTNTADANFAYQFGRNAMIGVGGTESIFNLPNPDQAQGLYNSHGGGASAFFDRRFMRSHYAGISYDYNRVWTGPSNALVEAELHSVLPFYTSYLTRTFSFSISGGMQHVSEVQTAQPASNSWFPAAVVSVGWQGENGAISASYLHTITTGNGLLGAFNSDSANGAGAWTFHRTWAAHALFSYSSVSATEPLVGFVGSEAGKMLAASGSVTHEFSERFSLEAGYQRLHENFGGIAVILSDPDSDRIFLTATYRFTKPLGR